MPKMTNWTIFLESNKLETLSKFSKLSMEHVEPNVTLHFNLSETLDEKWRINEPFKRGIWWCYLVIPIKVASPSFFQNTAWSLKEVHDYYGTSA